MALSDWRSGFGRQAVCPIWGTDAQAKEDSKAGAGEFFSARAGGRFVLEAEAAKKLGEVLAAAKAAAGDGAGNSASHSESLKRALTNWIVEHELRKTVATINTEVLGRVQHLIAGGEVRRATGAALSLRERGDRVLLLTDRLAPEFSEPLVLDVTLMTLAQAWSATATSEALWSVLRDLERRSCVDLTSRVSAEGPEQRLTLLPEGQEHLVALRKMTKPPQSQTLYAAQWHHGDAQAIFEQAIAPAAARYKLQALRLDRSKTGNRPLGEPLHAIRQARAVVVEMTGEAKSMPPGGLWFEAGFAAGLGVPILWTCRDDKGLRKALALEAASAPSGVLFWKTAEDLKMALEKRLEAVLAGGQNSEKSSAQSQEQEKKIGKNG